MSQPDAPTAGDFTIPQLPVRKLAERTAAPAPASASKHQHAHAPHPATAASSAEKHDAIVQGTSDDAATSKFSAMSLGYFRDEFLEHFLTGPRETARARRAPLINRGYWARVAAVTAIVQEFMAAGEEGDARHDAAGKAAAAAVAPSACASGGAVPAPAPAAAASSIPLSSPFHPSHSSRLHAGPPSAQAPPPFTPLSHGGPPSIPKQILSLGAGADTTYFKLKSAGLAPARYVEVDFAAPLERKAAVIRRTPLLRDLVAERNPTVGEEAFAAATQTAASAAAAPASFDSDPHSAAPAAAASATAASAAPSALSLPGAHDYALVGADLRDLEGLERALLTVGFDFTLPTLVLAECVLVYLPADSSTGVLGWLARRLSGGALVVNYEQLHPDTPFGRTMISNLEARGCALLGLRAYPDLDAQAKRYQQAGWDAHAGWDMNDVYRHYLAAGTVPPVHGVPSGSSSHTDAAAASTAASAAAAAPAVSPIGPAEVRRVERLELFDELEEWHLIQAHYHISMACKEPHPVEGAAGAEGGGAGGASAGARIPWRQIGLLHPARQHRRANPSSALAGGAGGPSHGGSIVVGGRTIMLGGAGPRASKPLEAQSTTAAAATTHASATHASGPSKGSLRKPPPPASAQ